LDAQLKPARAGVRREQIHAPILAFARATSIAYRRPNGSIAAASLKSRLCLPFSVRKATALPIAVMLRMGACGK
jgi:hypothetical protein